MRDAVIDGFAPSAYTASGLYPDAGDYSQPTIQLASYTNYGRGASAGDGSLNVTYAQTPVWVVTFVDVPDQGSGGGAPPTDEPSSPVSPTVLHDVVAIVSADTGAGIDVLSALPDPTPMAPPTGARSPTK